MPEPKTPNQNFPRLTMQQAKEEMACFQKIYPLVQLCTKILSEKPLFFLINSYTTLEGPCPLPQLHWARSTELQREKV